MICFHIPFSQSPTGCYSNDLACSIENRRTAHPLLYKSSHIKERRRKFLDIANTHLDLSTPWKANDDTKIIEFNYFGKA